MLADRRDRLHENKLCSYNSPSLAVGAGAFPVKGKQAPVSIVCSSKHFSDFIEELEKLIKNNNDENADDLKKDD